MKRVAVIAFAIILQLAFLPQVAPGGGIPVFALLLLLFFYFGDGMLKKMWPLALAAAVVLDVFSGFPSGMFVWGYLGSFALCAAALLILPRENIIHFVLFMMWGALWFLLAAGSYVSIRAPELGILSVHFIVVSLAYTAALSLVLYFFRKWIIA